MSMVTLNLFLREEVFFIWIQTMQFIISIASYLGYTYLQQQ